MQIVVHQQGNPRGDQQHDSAFERLESGHRIDGPVDAGFHSVVIGSGGASTGAGCKPIQSNCHPAQTSATRISPPTTRGQTRRWRT